MSTRANIIITDGYQNQILYRHSDGYPEGVNETLQKFVDWVAENKIRNNTGQAAGWLIVLGALEYCTIPEKYKTKKTKSRRITYKSVVSYGEPKDWKVGAYEPTNQIHGDIEYLYLIDLSNPSVKVIKNWREGKLSDNFIANAIGEIIIKPTINPEKVTTNIELS